MNDEIGERKVHAAIIRVDHKLLLEMMDLNGGEIFKVWSPHETWSPEHFNMVVVHPDLPEVERSKQLPEIVPVLEASYNEFGVKTSVKRIYPPKHGSQ